MFEELQEFRLAEFNGPPQNTSLSVRMPLPLARWIKSAAMRNRVGESTLIRMALTRYAEEHGYQKV